MHDHGDGPGYQHSETQSWQLSGPTSVRGSFQLVPAHWTDTGSGSSQETQGNQTRDITWTVKAAAAGRFQFVVRASDSKLLIGQANAQLRVANGITGMQRLTIDGVAQTPRPVGLEAFETQLPPIVTGRASRSVSGSTRPHTGDRVGRAVSAGCRGGDEEVRLEVRQSRLRVPARARGRRGYCRARWTRSSAS